MGLGLHFVDGEGPKFRDPVRDAAAIAKLGVPDMETELRYAMDAVRVIRRELDDKVPLIGFSGSPWTLRSEEHTSELQSLMRISYAVFCLKKTKNKHTHK